jgi:hypothetical protein
MRFEYQNSEGATSDFRYVLQSEFNLVADHLVPRVLDADHEAATLDLTVAHPGHVGRGERDAHHAIAGVRPP